jgi:DNA polymerase III epsilon subunit-like protein
MELGKSIDIYYKSQYVYFYKMTTSSLILVFDVETTGLLPKEPAPGNIPYIIQFSYVLYDKTCDSIVEKYNQYIRIPETVVLKPEITELTKITREKLENDGIPIQTALEAFYEAYKKAGILVAHNLQFDLTMLYMETSIHLPKLYQALQLEKDGEKIYYCTMKEGTDICQLKRPNSRGIYYKHPRLAELHKFLFGTIPEGLHDSMVDVLTTLRCYLMMKWGKRLD